MESILFSLAHSAAVALVFVLAVAFLIVGIALSKADPHVYDEVHRAELSCRAHNKALFKSGKESKSVDCRYRGLIWPGLVYDHGTKTYCSPRRLSSHTINMMLN